MKIIGIRKNEGEFQGRPFKTYSLTVQINNNDGDFGVNTKVLKLRSQQYDSFAHNHKINDYSKLVGYEYEMEYYDAYRNLVDLV